MLNCFLNCHPSEVAAFHKGEAGTSHGKQAGIDKIHLLALAGKHPVIFIFNIQGPAKEA